MDLHSLLESMGLVDAFSAPLSLEVSIEPHEPCCDAGCSMSCQLGCSTGTK